MKIHLLKSNLIANEEHSFYTIVKDTYISLYLLNSKSYGPIVYFYQKENYSSMKIFKFCRSKSK